MIQDPKVLEINARDGKVRSGQRPGSGVEFCGQRNEEHRGTAAPSAPDVQAAERQFLSRWRRFPADGECRSGGDWPWRSKPQ